MAFEGVPAVNTANQVNLTSPVQENNEGNFMARPVKWFRSPSESGWDTLLKVLAATSMVLVALTGVGLILVGFTAVEWNRQEAESKLKDTNPITPEKAGQPDPISGQPDPIINQNPIKDSSIVNDQQESVSIPIKIQFNIETTEMETVIDEKKLQLSTASANSPVNFETRKFTVNLFSTMRQIFHDTLPQPIVNFLDEHLDSARRLLNPSKLNPISIDPISILPKSQELPLILKDVPFAILEEDEPVVVPPEEQVVVPSKADKKVEHPFVQQQVQEVVVPEVIPQKSEDLNTPNTPPATPTGKKNRPKKAKLVEILDPGVTSETPLSPVKRQPLPNPTPAASGKGFFDDAADTVNGAIDAIADWLSPTKK